MPVFTTAIYRYLFNKAHPSRSKQPRELHFVFYSAL